MLDFVPDVAELTVGVPRTVIAQFVPLRDFEREADVRARMEARGAAEDAEQQKRREQAKLEHDLLAREDRRGELLRIFTNEQK